MEELPLKLQNLDHIEVVSFARTVNLLPEDVKNEIFKKFTCVKLQPLKINKILPQHNEFRGMEITNSPIPDWFHIKTMPNQKGTKEYLGVSNKYKSKLIDEWDGSFLKINLPFNLPLKVTGTVNGSRIVLGEDTYSDHKKWFFFKFMDTYYVQIFNKFYQKAQYSNGDPKCGVPFISWDHFKDNKNQAFKIEHNNFTNYDVLLASNFTNAKHQKPLVQ